MSKLERSGKRRPTAANLRANLPAARHVPALLLLALCAASAVVGVYMNDTRDFDAATPEAAPALPAATIGDSGNVQLKLGEKVALDHLGPTVVNADGSIKRIANWESLSEGERAAAWRRITKRNQERLATLRQQFEELQQQDKQQDATSNPTPAAAQPTQHDEL